MIPYDELVYALDQANGKVAPRAAAQPTPAAVEPAPEMEVFASTGMDQDFTFNPSESMDEDFGAPLGDNLEDSFGDDNAFDGSDLDVVDEEALNAGGFDLSYDGDNGLGDDLGDSLGDDFGENQQPGAPDQFEGDNWGDDPLGLNDDDLPPPPPPQ